MLDVNDTITLTYPSKPSSPASVTVTIGLPDGTTTAPVSAMSGTYTYTPSLPGRHTVLWVSTGPSDAYSDTFDVAEQTSSIISLDDIKKHLRMERSSNDEELRLFLSAATALIEHEVGPVVPASHTEIVNAEQTIVLARAPVMSVTSIVSAFPGAVSGPFPVPAYQLEGPSGILRQVPFMFSAWGFDYGIGGSFQDSWTPYGLRLTVTYVAGRPVVPAPLQVAARIILEHLWETRRLAGPKPAGGDEDQQFGREMIPDEAVLLMAPYRRAPLVA